MVSAWQVGAHQLSLLVSAASLQSRLQIFSSVSS